MVEPAAAGGEVIAEYGQGQVSLARMPGFGPHLINNQFIGGRAQTEVVSILRLSGKD